MVETAQGRVRAKVLAPANVLAALKSAGLSALIMLGLGFPIVAFRAEPDISNQLGLIGRWPLVFALAGAAFVLRFAVRLAFAARAERRARAADAPSKDRRGVRVSSGAATMFSDTSLGLLGIALLAAFPFAMLGFFGPAGALKWIDNYGIQILIYVMLGWGLNIVVGLAGLLDLGYIAFYAVGAYACALLATTQGLSFWLCLPIAGLLAALWGIVLGFPVLRLRGDYLAIVTLAFGEIIRLVLLNWSEVTNGDSGIGSIPKISFFGLPFIAGKNGFAAFFGIPFSPIHRTIFLFYVILALALVTNLVAVRLRRLPIGRAWEALREDEIACRALGINTVVTKLSAFALGAAFGGLAGAFFSIRQGFVSPSSFTFIESATILAIVVLGGRGSQIGVAAAAAVMIGGAELLRELDVLKAVFGADFDPTQYRMLIVGFAMVVMMNFKPQGLVALRKPSIFLHARKPLPVVGATEGKL
jgi:branched-chain amino acid transport system permease protein